MSSVISNFICHHYLTFVITNHALNANQTCRIQFILITLIIGLLTKIELQFIGSLKEAIYTMMQFCKAFKLVFAFTLLQLSFVLAQDEESGGSSFQQVPVCAPLSPSGSQGKD